MSNQIILTVATVTLLTLSATAQAQQDRRFTALVQPSYVHADHRRVTHNPGANDTGSTYEGFGSSSAASVAHNLGY